MQLRPFFPAFSTRTVLQNGLLGKFAQQAPSSEYLQNAITNKCINVVHLRKAWAGWGKPTVVARRPLFWYIGCGLLHTVHGILGHFDKKAFCTTLLCENHEFRPLIPTFFTKTVLQNAFCANMQFRLLFSYFLTQTVLQNAFCANMQFRPLFPTFGLRMEGRGEAGCPAIPTGGGCGHRMIPHRLLWW